MLNTLRAEMWYLTGTVLLASTADMRLFHARTHSSIQKNSFDCAEHVQSPRAQSARCVMFWINRVHMYARGNSRAPTITRRAHADTVERCS